MYASGPDDYLAKAKALSAEWEGRENDKKLVNFSIAPHAPYTVADENWKKAAALADELGLFIHTHLHETSEECCASLEGRADSMMCHHSAEKCRPIENFKKYVYV